MAVSPMSELNPAQQAELDRLVAEQSADDTPFISQRGERSLDAPITEDGFSLYEVVGEAGIESGPTQSLPKASHKIRPEQVREWRLLRKDGWTYEQIAEYAGVRDITVRRHLSKRDRQRNDSRLLKLEQRFDDAREAYEAGAFLREIAQLVFEEAGYASWESCYQALRRLFQRHGVAIRPQRISRRGQPSPDAPREEWQRFWRAKNQAAKERRRAALVRCDAIVGDRPCRRFTVLGTRFCASHNEATKPKMVWSREAVIAALREWAETHGRNPRASDWLRATAMHPSTSTVVNRFGRWNVALYEAGLRTTRGQKARTRAIVGRKANVHARFAEQLAASAA